MPARRQLPVSSLKYLLSSGIVLIRRVHGHILRHRFDPVQIPRGQVEVN